MITSDISKAIEICIELNIPFAAYALPGEEDITFYANPSTDDESHAHLDGRREFIVNYFNNDYPYIIGIAAEMTATEIIDNAEILKRKSAPEITPWSRDTDYMQYCSQVHHIVQSLRRRGGKTVLSRVITGEISPAWIEELDMLFNLNKNTFRNIYFTRETGCWFGTTPEQLFELGHNTDAFSTMSLAGTRLKSLHDEPWDKKNIDEHNFVTNYIISTLNGLGVNIDIGDTETISYSSIEHLCHRITGNIGNVNIEKLLTTLSPTPAVAGFPKDRAIEDIEQYEVHPRYCYAGFIGASDSDGLHIYVNLRCAHTDGQHICIYGGGGLTAESDAQNEWLETDFKTRNMQSLIRK